MLMGTELESVMAHHCESTRKGNSMGQECVPNGGSRSAVRPVPPCSAAGTVQSNSRMSGSLFKAGPLSLVFPVLFPIPVSCESVYAASCSIAFS